jgi:hypothetical protein
MFLYKFFKLFFVPVRFKFFDIFFVMFLDSVEQTLPQC